MRSDMTPLFGRIALEKGYLSEDHLDQLLGVYGRYEGKYPMGRIALKLKLLTEEQVTEVLSLQVAHAKMERAEVGPTPLMAPTRGRRAETREMPVVPEPGLAVEPTAELEQPPTPPPAPPPAPARPAEPRPRADRSRGDRSRGDRSRGDRSRGDRSQGVERSVAAEASELSMDLAQLLRSAVLAGASDLHLHTDEVPRLRVGSEVLPMEGVAAPDAETLTDWLVTLVPPSRADVWLNDLEVDFARDVEPGLRVRGNLYHERRGPAACLRLICGGPPRLNELGLPQDLARFSTFHNGLVLFTGPARCGKSTTLAAMVNLVNEERKQTVICVEDPIEVIHEGKLASVMQREVGHHTASFGTALRAALREDPDVIVVGELRDLETISLAVTAAETGHLVFATVHTRNAQETISRLVDVFPAEQQEHIRGMIAESLRGVVSQVLHAARDGQMVPVLEIVARNAAVSTCIRENKLHQLPSVMQTNRRAGMRRFDDSIAELFAAGTIDAEERDQLRERLGED